MSGEEIFSFIRHEMSCEIQKCPVRDPWFVGHFVRRSSKTFHVLCPLKWNNPYMKLTLSVG